MSKKNKRKPQTQIGASETAKESKSRTIADGTEKEQGDELKNEFKHLFISISVILIILAGIYYYDRQNGFLQNFAENILRLS